MFLREAADYHPFRWQVLPRRWKVDANSRQDAVLQLASVNLPGGVQVHSSLSSFIGKISDFFL